KIAIESDPLYEGKPIIQYAKPVEQHFSTGFLLCLPVFIHRRMVVTQLHVAAYFQSLSSHCPSEILSLFL
ncbi:hypothetical protein, partial [Bacillus mycoides]|uniref:hypothetical protein n=1 Tax=Bacillus mycoides TaxID=1405 RepID=UPI00381591D6